MTSKLRSCNSDIEKEICEKIKHRLSGKCLKKYYLRQEDFDRGTYRIKRSGIYILKENIVFEPNPDNDHLPLPDDDEYKGPAFMFGFFAAITVECHDVIIDLNCNTLRLSCVFALQQRFCSLIELASSPFNPNQCTANLGDINYADTCWVKNGNIGLSPQHGIHGIGCNNILIEDLKIFNFEVGGITINRGDYICIRNCDIGASRQDVPVLRNYGALRLLIPFYQHAVSELNKISPKPEADIGNATFQLLLLEQFSRQVRNDVLASGKVLDSRLWWLINKSGLPDGSAIYGIMLHPDGVGTNDYCGDKLSKYIVVSNVSIHGLSSKPMEVVGLSANDKGEGVFVDPSGSVSPVTLMTGIDGIDGRNVGTNHLAHSQLFYGYLCLKHPTLSKGLTNFNQDVVDWMNHTRNLNQMISSGYIHKCNSDWMFNVMKGVFGIRLGSLKHVYINNIKISYLRNEGLLGTETYCGNYIESHDAQIRERYHGADISGISFSHVIKSKTNCVDIFDLRSHNGFVYGVKLINKCYCICLDNIYVNKLISKYKLQDDIWYGLTWNVEYKGSVPIGIIEIMVPLAAQYPNLVPTALGISIEDPSCRKICILKYLVKCLIAPSTTAQLIYNEDISSERNVEIPHDH